MNILFFLSPKQDLMYVYDDFTLRQTLEKWENNRYASIPVLNRKGEYVGTLTEGDILWGLKKYHGLDLEAAEDVPISAFPHKRDYKAVTVTTSMDQLIEAAMNQNFVPVVDDRGSFIGIVRRQAPGLLRGQLAERLRQLRGVEVLVFRLRDLDSACLGAPSHKGRNAHRLDLGLQLHRAAHIVRLRQRDPVRERTGALTDLRDKLQIVL